MVEPGGDLGDRQRRRVGREHGVRRDDPLQVGEQRPLHVEPLDHDLDDQAGRSEVGERRAQRAAASIGAARSLAPIRPFCSSRSSAAPIAVTARSAAPVDDVVQQHLRARRRRRPARSRRPWSRRRPPRRSAARGPEQCGWSWCRCSVPLGRSSCARSRGRAVSLASPPKRTDPTRVGDRGAASMTQTETASERQPSSSSAHRELLERAMQAIRERTYWSAYPGAPEGVRRRGDARGGDRVPGDARPAVRARHAWRDGHRRRRAQPVRHRARRHVPARDRPRRAARGGAGRDAGLARRRAGGARGGVRGDPGADQRAVVRAGARGHAHDRPGVHDGVPGGRAARPGPRAGGDRVRARRDDQAAGDGALGEAAGQARPDRARPALHGRPARRGAGDRVQHVPDLEQLPGDVRQPGHREPGGGEAAPAVGPAAGDLRAGRARGAGGRAASTPTW